MSAATGVSRAALAAMLAWTLGIVGAARAQEASPPMPAPAEPAPEGSIPTVAADPDLSQQAGPADDPDAVPTTGGPALDPVSPPAETPVAAEGPPPAPRPPDDPLGSAVYARLADAAPLIPRLGAREREALQAFYALGDFRPVWIENRTFTPAAHAVMARLRAAGEDGLDPTAYPIPDLPASSTDDVAARLGLAEADLRLSAAAALYARDARGGRLNPRAISALITPVLDLPSPDAVVSRLVLAGDGAGDVLQAYNPNQPGYRALRSRLAALRGTGTGARPSLRLPAGPVLKPGMTDPRVPRLRAHFGLEDRPSGTLDAAPGDPNIYDRAVADAVAAFQRARGLAGDGALTRATVVALAGADASRGTGSEADLLVNMERWRWLPSDLGDDYVLVNVPEYRLKVVRAGRVRDETRVIVGKRESPTPLFSGLMEYAVVNPSWFVPPSILKKEFLPGLARDPNYAARRGYQVTRRGGAISVRQPPGERNALGFIKFLFPNDHAVYLHDTPNRALFGSSSRALSHGCVRVDDPFRFADAVLTDWSEERLRKLIGKGERTIRLSQKLPVHLAYFTASVDASGSYATLPDIYGYDAPMKAALGLARGDALVASKSVVAPAVLAKRKPAPDSAPRREPAQAQPAPARISGRAPAPAQRVRRATSTADTYEPGLWTPELARREPRSWW